MSDTTASPAAYTAADKIIADLSDRSGLDHEWDAIDPETRDEIRNTWATIIQDAWNARYL